MSYKIYAGTQTAVDTWDTKVCIYSPGSQAATNKLLNPTLTRTVGKAGSLEFTLPLGNVAHSALQKLRTVVAVERDGSLIWQGRVMSHEQDFLLRQTITCEGELAFLNDSSVPPYTAKDATVRQFLEWMVQCHNACTDPYKAFVVGEVTADKLLQYAPCAQACTLRLDSSSGSPDEDGQYYHEWGLYLPSGTRLIADFETAFTGTSTAPTPSALGWTVGVWHLVGGYAVQRTGDGLFTALAPALYIGGKTYTAAYTLVQGKITSALGNVQFGSTITAAASKTVSEEYALAQSAGRWTVSVRGTVSADFGAQQVPAVYSFGDGQNYGITWEVLQSELVDVYGGSLLVRHGTDSDGKPCRYLDYLAEITARTEQGIAFGTNLLDLTSYVKAENIVTRVVAIGKRKTGWWLWESTNTLTATADDVLAQKLYGIITRYLVLDGTANTQQALQDAADMELYQHLRYVQGITLKAVDLRDAGVDVDRLDIAKQTRILSPPHGIDTWLPCTKLVEPLDDPGKKEFTFGIEFSGISDLQALSARKATNAYDLSRTLREYAAST